MPPLKGKSFISRQSPLVASLGVRLRRWSATTLSTPPFQVIVCGLSFNQPQNDLRVFSRGTVLRCFSLITNLLQLFEAYTVIKGSSRNSSWKLRDWWKQRLVLRHFAGLAEWKVVLVELDSILQNLQTIIVFSTKPIPKFVLTLFDTPHLFSCWVSRLASIPVYNSPLCVDRKHSIQLALV